MMIRTSWLIRFIFLDLLVVHTVLHLLVAAFFVAVERILVFYCYWFVGFVG